MAFARCCALGTLWRLLLGILLQLFFVNNDFSKDFVLQARLQDHDPVLTLQERSTIPPRFITGSIPQS
eukprot:5193623-Amphidinium_carterae.1